MKKDMERFMMAFISDACTIVPTVTFKNYVLSPLPKLWEDYRYSFDDLVAFLDKLDCLISSEIRSNMGVDGENDLFAKYESSVILKKEWLEILGVEKIQRLRDFDEFVKSKNTQETLKKPMYGEDNCCDYDNKEELLSARNDSKYREFRNTVLRRDNRCKCCGYDKNHKHLVVHHIFGFKNYPALRYNEDNGIVLCKWCHEKYHSLFGRKNPNPVTFGEYMNKYGVK